MTSMTVEPTGAVAADISSRQMGLPPVWLTLGVCSSQAASAVV